MGILIGYLLTVVAGLLAALVAVFCLEIIAAIVTPYLRRVPRPSHGIRQRVAVLVPAHNESAGLLPTLTDVQSQLRSGDRLLVVADNCTDDTAAVAAAGNAEVTERHDPDLCGKGYALQWGIRHLGFDPPEIVIIVDADCRLVDGTVDEL